MPTISPEQLPYLERVTFLTELARRMHLGGTTAQRLESALIESSRSLGIHCEPFAQPTGLILSFSDPVQPLGTSEVVRVLRVPMVETDLHQLAEADRIAQSVIKGEMSLPQGYAAMASLDTVRTAWVRLRKIIFLMFLSCGVAMLLRLPWLDIGVATFNGFLAGLISDYALSRPRLHDATTALISMIAAGVVCAVGVWIKPINQNTLVIASLISFMPGMHLTNSINELSSGHLAAGVARFAGATSTVMQICVGALIAMYLFQTLGFEPRVIASRPQSDTIEMLGMLLAACSFAGLFNTMLRDWWAVVVACCVGYLVVRIVGDGFGAPVGIFTSAMISTALGNLYGRLFDRPGAIMRIPGIVMLVPGSASARAMLEILQGTSASPESAVLSVVFALTAIVAGIIFGNLFVPPRSSL